MFDECVLSLDNFYFPSSPRYRGALLRTASFPQRSVSRPALSTGAGSHRTAALLQSDGARRGATPPQSISAFRLIRTTVSLFAFLRKGRETEGVLSVCFGFAPRGTSAAAHCREVEALPSLPAACGLSGRAPCLPPAHPPRSPAEVGQVLQLLRGKTERSSRRTADPFPGALPGSRLPQEGPEQEQLLRVRSLGRAPAAATLQFMRSRPLCSPLGAVCWDEPW